MADKTQSTDQQNRDAMKRTGGDPEKMRVLLKCSIVTAKRRIAAIRKADADAQT